MNIKNTLVLLFTLFIGKITSAQDFPYTSQLKKELDTADFTFLKQLVPQIIIPGASTTYSITTKELNLAKSKEPSSERSTYEKINKLSAKLPVEKELEKGNTYLEIGRTYGYMNQHSMAVAYFDSALTIAKAGLDTAATDSLALLLAGNITMAAGHYEAALAYFNKLEAAKGSNAITTAFIPMMYIQLNRLEEARKYVDAGLRKLPEDPVYLYYDFMIQAYTFLSLVPARREFILSERFLNQPVDSVFDYTHIRKVLAQHENDVYWKQFESGFLLMGLYFKKIVRVAPDKELEDILILSAAESDLLNRLETDFKKISKSRKVKNKYLAYKSLGIISFLKKNNKESIKWFEKALDKRGLENIQFDNNPGDAYDNIIAVHLFSGDTLAAEKALLKRINDKPEINPRADDYASMAAYNWRSGLPQSALEYSGKAIQLDSTIQKGYVGMAACQVWAGKPSQAINFLNISLGLNREDAPTYLLYGIAALMKRDASAAFITLKAAYNLGGKKPATVILDRFFEKAEE